MPICPEFSNLKLCHFSHASLLQLSFLPLSYRRQPPLIIPGNRQRVLSHRAYSIEIRINSTLNVRDKLLGRYRVVAVPVPRHLTLSRPHRVGVHFQIARQRRLAQRRVEQFLTLVNVPAKQMSIFADKIGELLTLDIPPLPLQVQPG